MDDTTFPAIADRFRDDLRGLDPGILERFPVEAYIGELTHLPETAPYTGLISILAKKRQKIASSSGDRAVSLYNRLALAVLAGDSAARLGEQDFPGDILSLYKNWFGRVIKDLDSMPDAYFSEERDSFLKDISVCGLRMIPIGGAWTVDLGQVSKRALLAGGWLKLPGNIAFHCVRQCGFAPYYVIHTFFRYIPRFLPGEMEKAYLRIAGLLKRNPGIKGIHRSSWFLDPRMDEVSPRMSFLRQVPAANGARLYRIGTDDMDIQSATSNSPERKKLYAEGKYRPECWGYVWPREAVIAWAERIGPRRA